jgi:pyridoxine kinase
VTSAPPAILSVQSHVARGHVGNSAAVFALQRLGFEVWPVMTLQYSNHPGHETWRGAILPSPQVAEVLRGIAELGGLGDCAALLSGYLGSAETGEAVLEALGRLRQANPGALYCCDPVMGDEGSGLYVPETLARFMRERALPQADLVTPNRFELEQLSGRSTADFAAVLSAARDLLAQGPRLVLVTSLRDEVDAPGSIEMLAVEQQAVYRVTTPFLALDPEPKGAGDLTAALFLAHWLQGCGAATALERSAAAVHAVIAATAAAGEAELAMVAAQDCLLAPPRVFPVERVA